MKKCIARCAALALLTTLLYTGCKKDTNGTPSSLTVDPGSALPETFITISGQNMDDIVSIKFDTTAASFSSVFNTSTAIFTTVPTNAKFGDQLITLTNRSGQVATVNFSVIQPAPVVSSFKPSNTFEKDTVTITGKMFVNIQSVLIGAAPAQIIDSSSRTQLKITIPAGTPSGLVTVITAGGKSISASILNVGERALTVADFDGAGERPNGNSWYSYGDMTSKTVTNTNPDPKPNSGNFLKAVPKTASTNGYAGISTYTVGTATEVLGLTSTAATTIFKFDVNNNGKTGTKLQVIVQEGLVDDNPHNYSKTVNISGTGWNTIAIPLTEMFDGYGSGTTTPTPSKITKVKFHFSGYGSASMEANIDNVRFAY
jgi:hypothetical protein